MAAKRKSLNNEEDEEEDGRELKKAKHAILCPMCGEGLGKCEC